MIKAKPKPNSEKPKTKSEVVDITSVTDPLVIDKQAYLIWRRCLDHKLLNEEQLQIASDESQINLGWIMPTFKSKIEHLPPEEQAALMVKKRQYIKLVTMAGGMKMKAYGAPNSRSRVLDADGHNRSILQPKRAEIIELFGRMFSPQEVHKIAVEEWKIPCSLRSVHEFRDRYLTQITERIQTFKQEYSDIRLGIKRGRLEELVWLYTTMKTEYDKDHSVLKHKALITNLDQVRREVEGDVMKIEGNLGINLEANINVHLQQEVFKQININQIIIGRVASRMNLPAEMLIKALVDSYYHRLTGMVEHSDESAYDQLEYPSQIPYDFTKIEQIRKKVDEERREKIIELQDLDGQSSVAAQGLGLKEKLLLMIAKSAGAVSERALDVERQIGKLESKKRK